MVNSRFKFLLNSINILILRKCKKEENWMNSELLSIFSAALMRFLLQSAIINIIYKWKPNSSLTCTECVQIFYQVKNNSAHCVCKCDKYFIS